ncbi:hypothetical protein [Microbacterium sp. USHLN272]|uniref:hypothetical protein n=1 Tax=Microbacterium sp. USHLN272 TaxID=3081287 RepID=UPI00301A8523
MAILPDSTAEVQGRNRELSALTASASPATRKLFIGVIEALSRLQLDGASPEANARYERLEAELQRASERTYHEARQAMEDLLRTTNRMRSTDLATSASTARGPSYSRFAWLLGVAGSDDPDAAGTFDEFAQGAAHWYAESLIHLIANPTDSHLLGIHPWTTHARMEPEGIRFRWVCHLVATGIDAWATEQGGSIAEMFGQGQIVRFSEEIGRALPLPGKKVLVSLHPAVLTAMTAPRATPASFSNLVEGSGPELRPLIDLDGEIHVGNASALVFGLDVVLISAIKEIHGSDAQGDAFEYLCNHIAQELLPPDIHTFRDSFVSDSMTSPDGDEVDLHLRAKGIDVIIEAKSYLPAKDAASAAASYDQLLGANKQIRKRVSRLQSGCWIRRRRPEQGDHVSGLVAVLHGYSAQVWRPQAMVESGVPAFIAMPLQAFTIFLGCLRSADDLKSFMRLRNDMGAAGISGGDELEFLLGWMSGWTPESFPRVDGAIIQVRPYFIETHNQISASWEDVESWRQLLFEVSKPVHA